ncbi:MAG: 30S ribosomal protein S20 [Minisyncoccia bacterium]
MPITSSAKKALRASKHKKVFNLRRKNVSNDVIKELRTLVADKKIKEAKALLPRAYQVLDKSVKTKLIKKNTASRLKSRLSALIKKNQ